MPYTTKSGASTDPAAYNQQGVILLGDYYPDSETKPESRLDALLRRAERRVRELAPRPENATEEQAQAYKVAARDTELAATQFLLERPASVDKESILDASTTYASADALDRLIVDGMGEYARSGKENVAYVGPVPW